MNGSGRAILSLREGYRNDLRACKSIFDLQYVRFHGIFHDEVGVYDEDKDGKPLYNFSYVDQIYDGLLENHVRPFVELSFTPKKMASKDMLHGFWYHPNVSPPKDPKKWGDFISAFVKHLVDRYGEDEVSKWYFEVWNEPNLDFWGGDPHESTYYDLYDVTARAVKSVNSKLLVGGPATAQAAWTGRFIDHCVKNNVPVDFVSTHVYGDDTAKDVFNTDETIPRASMVARAMKKVHDEVKASSRPNLPIIWSEFNATYMNKPEVTDSAFMGPWLANHIKQADGLADEVSYWTFSDVFEEQGVVKKPFYGGYGLIAAGSIPKAAFNAFKLLHLLGSERLKVTPAAGPGLATKHADGNVAVAIWNYATPEESGAKKTITVKLDDATPFKTAHVWRVNGEHGSSYDAWLKMGSPDFPTQDQLKSLRSAAKMDAPQVITLDGKNSDGLKFILEPKELRLVEFRK